MLKMMMMMMMMMMMLTMTMTMTMTTTMTTTTTTMMMMMTILLASNSSTISPGPSLCGTAPGGMLRTTPHTQICHVDVVEVVLVAEKRNFGLQVDPTSGRSSTTFEGHRGLLVEPPVISYIEPRGPAER